MYTDLVPDIQRLIRSTDFAQLRERLVGFRPVEIAGIVVRRRRPGVAFRGRPEHSRRRFSISLVRLQRVSPDLARKTSRR